MRPGLEWQEVIGLASMLVLLLASLVIAAHRLLGVWL